MITLKAPDYLRIEVTRNQHLLYTTWLRQTSSEELRAGVLRFLQVIREYDIRFWIIDAHQLRSPSVADQQWILKEVSPELAASGLRKLARIGSSDVFQYIAYENIADKTHSQFLAKASFAQFTSLQAAQDWINMMD
ncbi:hypothetical protein [Pontibacter liquoris]|uniref:hypothetical protein n=1 Tax=Pontibacter liquoris TaxID=2905677 RepID=UPI001FA7CEB0|nr:hypothetical protein [Pontibacter liquoris]